MLTVRSSQSAEKHMSVKQAERRSPVPPAARKLSALTDSELTGDPDTSVLAMPAA
jgi:hypothetical protein